MADMTKLSEKEKAELDHFKDVGVQRSGKQIVLPDGMTIRTAIKLLNAKEEADLMEVNVNEAFEADPFEGAVALHSALAEMFGWATPVPTPGFFGPRPPEMINVPIDFDRTVSVPWGRMEVPMVRGFLATGIDMKNNRPVFQLGGTVKNGDMHLVRELCAKIKMRLKEQSIYTGKAFKMTFPKGQSSLLDFLPVFMDPSRVSRDDLIFSDRVGRMVEASVFTPILKTARLRAENIPRKRGVLLSGKFGVGKTLTAAVVARMCVENGWTYVSIDDPTNLASAIEFAQRFQPSVVFCEDVDRALRGERTQSIDEVLNTIDGIKAKNTEVMVILTTNELTEINRAMIRPGRIDVVIEVEPPDAKAAIQLVEKYARNKHGATLLEPGINLAEVGITLADNIPAVIREIVERSKLAAIARLEDDQPMTLAASDLLTAAHEMTGQIELLKPAPVDQRTSMEKFGHAMGARIESALENMKADTLEALARLAAERRAFEADKAALKGHLAPAE